MARGFAAGLADGIGNAMQMYQYKQYHDGLNDAREERNRILAEQAETKAAGAKGEKGLDREGFANSLIPIFKTSNPSSSPEPRSLVMKNQGGLGPDTLPDTGLLSNNAAGAYQVPGLASVSPAKSQPQPTQPDEDFNPIHEIVKQIGFGDLANQPAKLNAIRAAAAMHGMGKDVGPWLDSLVAAKRTGIFDAAMDLKRGNVDGAMDNLKRGGIQLEDRPVKVNPNDPNDGKWKVNISGSGEQVIDLDHWATSTLDPEKYSKFLLDRQGAADKTRLTDAQIDNQKSGAEKNRAMAKAYSAGSLGAGRRTSSGSLAPTVRRTVETDQGIVAIMSDGSKRVIADDNGNPLFGTSGQKTAAQLVGKTLSPMDENVDIAGKVNSLASQLQSRRQPGSASEQENPKVRKFNPATGRFD
jgi:hypothetical protein